MRRLGSSDSLGALMSICPISDGFDEKEWVEASGHVTEKKRRLNVDQVKGLEKDFEVENKLDPVRKLKLAQQLGLEPRQVAIWFQNRRARWKTKQLERDYGVLKTRYETLKVNYDTLHHDNQLLLKEIKEVKAKLNGASNVSVEEEAIVLETDDKTLERSEQEQKQWINYDRFNKSNGSIGLSEYSDSSGILNEDNNKSSSNNVAVSSSGILHRQHVLMSQKNVKMEEHDLLSADEACNFFSNEEAPSLDWYCSEQWN